MFVNKNFFLSRLVLIFQVLGTLSILAWFPTNIGKTVAFLVLWFLTFCPLNKNEIILYIGACILFTVMDILTLQKQVFVFSNPDFLGIPLYEVFMWGFYLLHTVRIIGGPVPQGNKGKCWVLAILFASSFSLISSHTLLFGVTGGILLISLIFYHEPFDIAYLLYMLVLGVAVEYTGVLSGQWRYPGIPIGRIPLWFLTLWGGVGFFLRRLILPLLFNEKLKI